MGFIVEKKPFLGALASVMPAVASRAALPVLSGVRIGVTDNGYSLEATDLELAIRINRLAKRTGQGVGCAVVPAKAIANAVKSLPGEKVKVDLRKSADHPMVEVSSGNRNIDIEALPATDWPEIATGADFDSLCQFEAKDLADALARIVLCASTDESRPVLTGVQFNFQGEALKLVATDSYRLGVLSLGVEPSREDLELALIVPANALKAVAKSLKKEDCQGVLRVGKSGGEGSSVRFVAFSFGDSDCWLVREIEGEFPNWEALMPDMSTGAAFEVDSVVLASAAGGAAKLKVQKSTPVRLLLGDSCELRMEESGMAMVAESLAGATYSPNGVGPMAISFSPEFLGDAVTFIGKDRIRMRSTDPLKPAVFLGENCDRTYVLMPVRLGR